MPQKIDLPTSGVAASAGGATVTYAATSGAPGCPDKPVVKLLGYAWNAQRGLLARRPRRAALFPARIQATYDLVQRGLAWRTGASAMPEFLELLGEIARPSLFFDALRLPRRSARFLGKSRRFFAGKLVAHLGRQRGLGLCQR